MVFDSGIADGKTKGEAWLAACEVVPVLESTHDLQMRGYRDRARTAREKREGAREAMRVKMAGLPGGEETGDELVDWAAGCLYMDLEGVEAPDAVHLGFLMFWREHKERFWTEVFAQARVAARASRVENGKCLAAGHLVEDPILRMTREAMGGKDGGVLQGGAEGAGGKLGVPVGGDRTGEQG
jgi:hypothetical protein